MESTGEFSQTIDASWQALASSLLRPDFYIELTLIAVAIAIAWLASVFLRGQLVRALERHPPHKIDKSFLIKPTVLLTPLLAFFALSIAKPFAHQYAEGGEWTAALMQLSLAAAAARVVLLLVQSRGVAFFIAFVIIAMTLLDVTGFMESTKAALSGVAFSFGKFRLSMLGLVQGIIILVIVFWVASVLSNTLESYLQKGSRLSYNTRVLVVKFFKMFVYFVAFLITLSAMGIDLTALAIFGGAMGVGVGLGLQKLTANFVSGVTLLMEKSIKIGDLIEVTGITGWVRQLNVRYALIETFDGRELMIPNEMLVSTQVTNWTHSNDMARVEFPVGVAYDSDVDLVIRLVMEAITENAKSLSDPPPTCQLREFGNSSLNFYVNFWIGDVKDGRRGPQSEVMLAILSKFRAHNIEIPFPHQVEIQKTEVK
jgi:small-conductance mechanosensitive channel